MTWLASVLQLAVVFDEPLLPQQAAADAAAVAAELAVAAAAVAAVALVGLCLPEEAELAQSSLAQGKVGEAGVAALLLLQAAVVAHSGKLQMRWCPQLWTQSHPC